jgi:prepilin-type N-terminal cleavage/methylation domain-containing protein
MREDGFTVIEVLVAILLVGVGIGAVITAMTMPEKQTLTAQRAAQAGTIADRTLESVVRLGQTAAGWGTIAPTPATASLLVHQSDPNGTNPTDPRAFITGSSLQIAENYHDAAQGTVGTEALAPSTSPIPGGGTSTGVVPVMVQCPGGAGCASGDPPGKVYAFVTYRNESCSLQLPGNVLNPALNQIGTLLNTILGGLTGLVGKLTSSLLGIDLSNTSGNLFCQARNESKRVTVAVVLDKPGTGAAPLKPVYESAIVPNPNAGILANGVLGGGGLVSSCTVILSLVQVNC